MVLDGLDPNTEYYVNVTAVTDTLESDASNGLRVVTQTDTSESICNACMPMYSMCQYMPVSAFLSSPVPCPRSGSDEKSMIWIVAVIMVALVLVAIIVLIVGVR